jgi:hypothetical protein
VGQDGAVSEVIWVQEGMKIFFETGLDREIPICPSGKNSTPLASHRKMQRL